MRRTAHATAAAASPVFGRSEKINDYGYAANGLTALAEHQNYRDLVFASQQSRTTRRYKVARTLRKVSRALRKRS